MSRESNGLGKEETLENLSARSCSGQEPSTQLHVEDISQVLRAQANKAECKRERNVIDQNREPSSQQAATWFLSPHPAIGPSAGPAIVQQNAGLTKQAQYADTQNPGGVTDCLDLHYYLKKLVCPCLCPSGLHYRPDNDGFKCLFLFVLLPLVCVRKRHLFH